MSTYEISKSSLLSLKAEILRKQQELTKAKADNVEKIKTIKKNTPLELKNKGIENRQKNDLTEAEEDLLKKSRSVLEAKSKLYDKLTNTSTKLTEEEQEFNKRYLVRFDKKNNSVPNFSDDEPDVDNYPESEEENHDSDDYETANNPGDEWVEYVDCLGRTRKCLRKDLDFLKSKDEELKSRVACKENNDESSNRVPENEYGDIESTSEDKSIEVENEVNENSELLSSDMRRELLRKQWEKEEEQLQQKTNIHYQDILFNEARTHGVGYYGFSKDEEERFKQQEALKKLRDETEQQQKKSQELKALREKQLAARLKAARNRKRARMGLPPEEDDPVETTTSNEKEDEEAKKKEEEERKKNEEKERILDEARKNHLRPWDIGKDKVKEHYVYSQEEWVEKQRKERPTEFAPPSQYRTNFRSDVSNFQNSDTDKSLHFSTKKSSSTRINPYKHSDYEPIQQNMPMQPTKIVNECVSDQEADCNDRLLSDYKLIEPADADESSDSSDDTRGKGTEIAPPPTFDYYGPSSSKRVRPNKGAGIEDSIEAGLKFIRKQIEKKESSTKHPREMFLS